MMFRLLRYDFTPTGNQVFCRVCMYRFVLKWDKDKDGESERERKTDEERLIFAIFNRCAAPSSFTCADNGPWPMEHVYVSMLHCIVVGPVDAVAVAVANKTLFFSLSFVYLRLLFYIKTG